MANPKLQNITCPKCGGHTLVFNTRSVKEGNYISRRRHCQSCGHRLTTKQQFSFGKVGEEVVCDAIANQT